MIDPTLLEIVPPVKIYVKESPGKGLGVFARNPIMKGDVVEVAPVRVLSVKERDHLIKDVPPLADYDFYWSDRPEASGAIAFGYAELYNHSENPNVDLVRSEQNRTISFVAKQDIHIGEELCFDYGIELWFDAK